jgi:hypothetical protein
VVSAGNASIPEEPDGASPWASFHNSLLIYGPHIVHRGRLGC